VLYCYTTAVYQICHDNKYACVARLSAVNITLMAYGDIADM